MFNDTLLLILFHHDSITKHEIIAIKNYCRDSLWCRATFNNDKQKMMNLIKFVMLRRMHMKKGIINM
jgi:hypothetical protein